MISPRLSLCVLILFVALLSKTQAQCPCLFQTSCQIVANADAIVQALIISQQTQGTTVNFSALVKRSYKGTFTQNQLLSISANPNCVQLQNHQQYVISMISNVTGLWVDNCGIHTSRSNIGSDLWKTLTHYSKMCGQQCIDTSGNIYQSGQSWNPTPCESCSCRKGTTRCLQIDCAAPACNNSYIPQGQCCPVCPQNTGQCTYGGVIYQNGENWNPKLCQTCSCANGVTTCFQNSCPPLMCDNKYIPDGQCCPVCMNNTNQQCTYQGQVYSNGQSWSPSACRSCSCQNGVTRCVDIQCQNLTCAGAYVPAGQCCAVCPQAAGQCVYGGKNYTNGATWNPTPCRSCVCNNGIYACADLSCPVPDCKNSYTPQGQCCPVCPQSVGQCLYNGNTYTNGQSWNPSSCRSCRCDNGITTCTTIQCLGTLPCNNSYVPEGQCCPVCPASNCYDLDGNMYLDGQKWSPLPCQNCTCDNGTTRCTVWDCALPTCSNWYIPSGQCCPVCPVESGGSGCTAGGVNYANGASWSANGCQTCTCSNGKTICAMISCPPLACPSSFVPDGQCCPVCR